jgi:GST-like protein
VFLLYHHRGWGSAIIEAELVALGLPHRVEEVGELFTDASARAALARVNPLAQVPTLVLPSGEVMTESAAITLHLADASRSDKLVPGAADPLRPAFLRWLVFLVANIYPTFAYADTPGTYVPPEAEAPFLAAVGAQRQALWRLFAAQVRGPWVLGERFSALDLYVAAMVHWSPRRAWFAAELPALDRLAGAVLARGDVGAVMARNFG